MTERSRLRSYFGVSQISLRNMRQYTIEFLTTFVYFPAKLIALYIVYSIIYIQAWLFDGTTVIGGFSFPELMSYLFISVILISAIPLFRLSMEIEKDIVRGPLISYLARPIDYSGFKVFAELPRTLVYLAFGAFTYLIALFLLPLNIPTNYNLLLFIGFFYLAFFIAFLLVFIIALAAFWMSSLWWIRHLLGLTMSIAGGALIPLTYFPPLAQIILGLLPFQFLYYVPTLILQGYYQPQQLLPMILLGIFWFITLYLLSRLIWYFGRRRYEGAGG